MPTIHHLLPPEKIQEIKEKANTVLANYASIPDAFERMLKIATDHGITILESNIYEMSGALRKEGDAWFIYINQADSRQRQLFTIAHELGHFFVHKEVCDEFVDGQLISRNEQTRYAEQELEANEFAGNLIMPEGTLRQKISVGNLTEQKVIALAKEFQVSSIAMATRLRNLDYDVPEYTQAA